jgi:hypothetical protein
MAVWTVDSGSARVASTLTAVVRLPVPRGHGSCAYERTAACCWSPGHPLPGGRGGDLRAGGRWAARACCALRACHTPARYL